MYSNKRCKEYLHIFSDNVGSTDISNFLLTDLNNKNFLNSGQKNSYLLYMCLNFINDGDNYDGLHGQHDEYSKIGDEFCGTPLQLMDVLHDDHYQIHDGDIQ